MATHQPPAQLRKRCLPAARACADWVLRNQVTRRDDANCGRFLMQYFTRFRKGPSSVGYFPGARKRERYCYSTVWNTATTALSLLMLHRRTGKHEYWEAARLAAGYLKTLQIYCSSHPHHGFFREVTPQTVESNVRDACTGGWAMLHLSRALKDDELLDRAVAFAGWLKRHGFRNRFPARGYMLEPRPDAPGGMQAWKRKAGPTWGGFSAHGGSMNLFLELYEATGQKTWLNDIALPALDTFIDKFMLEDGSLVVLRDLDKKLDVVGLAGQEQHRHRYNDDFASLALIKAYKVTGDDRYRDAARRYLDWAASVQNRDGSFGDPPVKAASATLPIEMLDMQTVLGRPVYADAIDRAVEHLLALQVRNHRSDKVRGAFWCLSPWVALPRTVVHLRTSSYAMAVLLKLEGAKRYPEYTATRKFG